MTVVSPTNSTRLRYAFQRVTNVNVNVFRLEVKATASINQVSFDYPIAELTVDGTSAQWGDVREGELFEILDGSGNVIYTDNHRKNPTADTVYLSRIQLGSNQRAAFTALPIGNDYTIRSYTAQTPASFVSRVDEESEETIIYKRVDIELNEEYPQPEFPKPQPNYGSWRQANAAGDGTAQFDIDATRSFSLLGGTLSYLHEPPDGMTIVTGTSTDAAVTIEADAPGQYAYSLRVEDSAIPSESPQRQKRSFRYFFVNGETYPAFSQQFTTQIIKDDESRGGGRVITFRAYGDGAIDELYTGAPILLTYDIQVRNLPTANWITLDEGLSRRTFAGYITSFTSIRTGRDGVKYVEFTAENPLSLYTRLPIANQLLQEAVTVTNWQQTVSALMQVLFACYYVMEYHAPASLYLHDLLFDTGVDNFKSNPFPIRAGSITTAVKTITERILGFFTCDSDGALWIKRNPIFENDTYRGTVDDAFTWTDQDISDDGNGLEYSANRFLTVSETSGGFSYYESGENRTAYGRSNLFAPAQATGRQDVPFFIALDKADGLARIGHVHQFTNRPVESIEFSPTALTGEYVSPALLEWHTLDCGAYDVGGMNVLDMRYLATKVIRQWTIDKPGGVTLRYLLTFEPETTGQPASEVIYKLPTGDGIPPTQAPECEELLANNKTGAWVDMVFPTSSAKTYAVTISGGPYTFAGGGRLRDFVYIDTQATPTALGQWTSQLRGGLSLSVPAYSATHIYTWTGVTGTDQAWGFRVYDTAYSDNEDANFTIEVCEEV